MKKILLLLILLIFCCAFTWEGELDPNEFDKWRVVSAQLTPQGFLWIYVKNPDQESSIKVVAMAVAIDATLLGYRYWKSGEPYSFVFDPDQDKYVKMNFTEMEKRSCRKCHGDKSTPI